MVDSSPAVSWQRTLLAAWLMLAIGYIALIPVANKFVLDITTGFRPASYSLLLSLGAIAAIAILREGAQVNSLLLAPAGLWLTLVGYGIVVGVVRHAESWPRVLVFFLFWPLVYFVVVI